MKSSLSPDYPTPAKHRPEVFSSEAGIKHTSHTTLLSAYLGTEGEKWKTGCFLWSLAWSLLLTQPRSLEQGFSSSALLMLGLVILCCGTLSYMHCLISRPHPIGRQLFSPKSWHHSPSYATKNVSAITNMPWLRTQCSLDLVCPRGCPMGLLTETFSHGAPLVTYSC